MTLHYLKWTFTPEIVTWNTLAFCSDLLVQKTFFCSVYNHSIKLNTSTELPSAPPTSYFHFCHPSSQVFLPPHALVTTALHCLSTLNQCIIMVGDADTKGQASEGQGRVMEGYWVGQGEELSLILGAVKAVMHTGHSDLRLFLSLPLSALFRSTSAPSLALCCPCRLCLDTVGLSPCVCVCMSHSSNMRPQRGEPWRGLWG